MFSSPASDREGRAVRLPAGLSMGVILLALAGCASEPVDYQGLASASQLQPVKDDEAPFQFRSPTANLKNYSKVQIDPVVIYSGPDSQFGSVPQEDRKSVAAYMQQKFAAALSSRYQIVTVPEPGTLRLHLTLTGIETGVPVLSTISHLTPAGLVINTGLEATDRNGTFFGAVSYAAELYDAQNGKLLYAYVTRQTPDALDVTASLGTLAAAREGVRIGATHLRNELSNDAALRGTDPVGKPMATE
jgi:hypothetical protein